jgi:hypothetical protein
LLLPVGEQLRQAIQELAALEQRLNADALVEAVGVGDDAMDFMSAAPRA